MRKRKNSNKRSYSTLEKIFFLFLTLGIIIVALRLVILFSYNSTSGTITDIWERKRGMEYQSVEKGGEYPCKLEITYTDSDGEERVDGTNKEIEPCSTIFAEYYKVGDSIDILYYQSGPSYVGIRAIYLVNTFTVIILVLVLALLGFRALYKTERKLKAKLPKESY